MTVEKQEIGELKEIGAQDILYLFHREGNPLSQALMIKALLDGGWTQQGIAQETGMSQPKISMRLKLLNLHPNLQERALKGDILPSTCWKLANLPLEEQEAYIAREKIPFKEVEERCRRLALTEEVMEVLDTPLPTEERPNPRRGVTCPRCGLEFEVD